MPARWSGWGKGYFGEEEVPLEFVAVGNFLENTGQSLGSDGVETGEEVESGLAEHGHESAHLVDVVVAAEEDGLAEHFCEDAADGPDVDGLGVGVAVDKYFWGAVRSGGYVVGYLLGVDFLPREVHIGYLQFEFFVDEDVLGLHVTVDDFS